MADLTNTIETLLSEGEYYNALLMYKTVAFRYKKRGTYEKAIELLKDGIAKFINVSQFTEANELSLILIQV
jgi:golgi to ER traffic protein 4